jgi:hypothetical protein
MIKTVYIPLTFKYDPMLRQVKPEAIQPMREKAEDARLKAEADLNALIEQGYTRWTQEQIETASGVDLAIILYKPDEPKPADAVANLPDQELVVLQEKHRRGVRQLQLTVADWMESDMNNFKQWLLVHADPDVLEQTVIDVATILPKEL